MLHPVRVLHLAEQSRAWHDMTGPDRKTSTYIIFTLPITSPMKNMRRLNRMSRHISRDRRAGVKNRVGVQVDETFELVLVGVRERV